MKKILHDRQRIFYAINLIIFCLMLLLNCLTPLSADDFTYSFIFGADKRVESFSDVAASEWNHYFIMNGRIVSHSIAQFFLWIGKPFFNIANSIIFIIYINLISCFSFGKRSIAGVLSSFLMVWLFIPVPGSVLFWLDGACNYLCGATFIFLFISQYYHSNLENNEVSEKSFFIACLWFLLGLIAGWCNENTSGMGILICCLLTLYQYATSKQLFLRKIMGILGAVLGFSLMLVAPGNQIRATAFDVPIDPFENFFNRFVEANKHGFGLSENNRILFLVFLFTYVFILFLPKVSNERKIIGGIWFLGALACNYAMTLSPYYPDRASFGVFSMYFVSILYAGKTLIEYFNASISMSVAKVMLCVGFLCFIVSYPVAAWDIGSTYIQNNNRVATVLEEKSKGNYDIIVPAMEPTTKYNVFSSVDDWPYFNVAEYYGVDSITLQK